MRSFTQRNARPIHHGAAPHLFAVGQAVRVKGGFGTFPRTAEIYRVTATLPPRGNSPQYRIRNEGERHERMATEDSLEAAETGAGDNAALIERTFGHGQETLGPRDQEAEKGKGAGQA